MKERRKEGREGRESILGAGVVALWSDSEDLCLTPVSIHNRQLTTACGARSRAVAFFQLLYTHPQADTHVHITNRNKEERKYFLKMLLSADCEYMGK